MQSFLRKVIAEGVTVLVVAGFLLPVPTALAAVITGTSHVGAPASCGWDGCLFENSASFGWSPPERVIKVMLPIVRGWLSIGTGTWAFLASQGGATITYTLGLPTEVAQP